MEKNIEEVSVLLFEQKILSVLEKTSSALL